MQNKQLKEIDKYLNGLSAAKFATIDGDSKPNKYQSGLESPYDNYDSNHVYEQKEKRSSSIKPDRYQQR